ncbi:DUF72 domain-containing protein [Geomonas sp. RF6]|uniref:DUF72 domain-containing protein n=1 Tax=Geomonas sp. RF6 TaxID=2897342 RepID=UPI001E53C3D9|nr:DUF72 domain-containing protein [Geomonas sp. RF6]UFS70297.1 DUF72 domain-containing protein [Geomonas sp. RF6]
MIRVGSCSWTEKSLLESGVFYPSGVSSAEGRLRHYAASFDTVEVDSSYYAIPAQTTTTQWSERTPEGFLFHLKAYAALTGHNINPKTLPKDLFELLPEAERRQPSIRIADPLFLLEIAAALVSAVEPLRSTKKLGFLIFQFPPWFGYKTAHLDYLLQCKEMMKGLPVAVEFRHGSWLTRQRADETFSFLREHKITYITADEPHLGTLATIPFLPETTTPIAYLRLHGRNRESWLSKGHERYHYNYSEAELLQLGQVAREMSVKARTVFVMFNNCHIGYAIINALQMQKILHGNAPSALP